MLFETIKRATGSAATRTALFWLSLVLSVVPCGTELHAQNLPELSDSAAQVMSSDQEKLFGRQVMLNIRAQGRFSEDILLLDYFTRLATRLASHSPRAFGNLTIALAIDPTINAFAVPGGYITLNTGLIENTHTEAELASVIAHEIGHQSQRHIARMIERSKQLTLPAAAALIGGLLIGGEAGKAAIISTQAAVASDQLTYSRTFEREADATGMQILAESGFDPNAMPAFFDQLEKQARLHSGSVLEFLSTHPVSSDRIADGLSRARQMRWTPSNETHTTAQLDFRHAKTRTQALFGEPVDAVIKSFALSSENPGLSQYERQVAAYGLSIALLRHDEIKRAGQVLQKLREKAPDNPLYQLAEAEFAYASGNTASAVEKYARLYEQDRDHPAFIEGYARALLTAGDSAAATRIARKAIRHHPEFLWAYPLLAQAYGSADMPLNAIFIQAQQLQNEGQYGRALDLLNLTSKNTYPDRSDYLTASIESLIRQLQEERRQLDAFEL